MVREFKMPDFQSILSTASRLPVAERLELIDALWETVPEDALPPLSEEWIVEVQRRSAEFDAETVKTLSWEEVRREAFRRAGIDDDR